MTRDVVDHYASGYEDGRTTSGLARFEYQRTREIISRYVGPERAVVLDVGGGTGAYAFWLAELGHEVHLLDLVPRHVEIAREKAARGGAALASARIGDARSLPFDDRCADLVLLMGPLYHLTEREDRLRALGESGRVVKRDGTILCAAISRFASMLDGFRSGYYDNPEFEKMVDRDLREGQHRNVAGRDEYFTTAFFHHPAELRAEIEAAGLVCEKLLGVEGPLGLMNRLEEWLDGEGRYHELALEYARRVEEEESLLGSSFHLLGVCRCRSRLPLGASR